DHEDGAGPPQIPGLYETLDRTLGASLRRQIGLDQARVLVAAAAPSHPDLIRWFHAVGLPILDLYGQTEGCGPTTANRIGNVRIGTVGVPFPGMEVRVADDGEVLLRGGNVCLGYLDDPEGTAALLEGGWMHTGDLGAFDEDGFLRIVGRKKDLIITAAGKNVSPQGIETDLRNQPLISEAIVIGEGRRYLTALITLDPEELTRWAAAHHRLGDVEALGADPDVLAEVQAAVDVVNARRSHAEHIRRFQVLSRDLTGAAGELTPTMKVKRAVVYDRYRDVIDELYAGT
ncbi:AMP-binding protein, partial [Acidimicrobiaceae bacterium USS-CC1]|nr:AMP-binding protein [Acidiferrimicrobium australe]